MDPFGNTCANARYPALPFMSHFISNHEIDWVLDDAYRDEEKLTAELWKNIGQRRIYSSLMIL